MDGVPYRRIQRKNMRRGFRAFFAWYERRYHLNVAIAAALFALQIVHLVWLTGEVVVERLSGEPLFVFEGAAHWLIVLVDYTEIPALLSVSLLYVNELRKRLDPVSLAYLVFLNTQWLHIFWITDEFVVDTGAGSATGLPGWLAWIAISI